MFSTLIIDELKQGGNLVGFPKKNWCWKMLFSILVLYLSVSKLNGIALTKLLISSICSLYIYIFINVNNDENTKAIWWILEGLISLRAFIDCRPGNNGDTVIAYKHILLHKGVGGNPDMRNYNSTTLHPYTCWSILIHLPVYDLFSLQH